jgi:hypothetical protein
MAIGIMKEVEDALTPKNMVDEIYFGVAASYQGEYR